MKTQLTFAVVILSLTIVGLLTLPSLYHQGLGVFGLGCGLLAVGFAWFIYYYEHKAYRPKSVRSTYLPPKR